MPLPTDRATLFQKFKGVLTDAVDPIPEYWKDDLWDDNMSLLLEPQFSYSRTFLTFYTRNEVRILHALRTIYDEVYTKPEYMSDHKHPFYDAYQDDGKVANGETIRNQINTNQLTTAHINSTSRKFNADYRLIGLTILLLIKQFQKLSNEIHKDLQDDHPILLFFEFLREKITAMFKASANQNYDEMLNEIINLKTFIEITEARNIFAVPPRLVTTDDTSMHTEVAHMVSVTSNNKVKSNKAIPGIDQILRGIKQNLDRARDLTIKRRTGSQSINNVNNLIDAFMNDDLFNIDGLFQAFSAISSPGAVAISFRNLQISERDSIAGQSLTYGANEIDAKLLAALHSFNETNNEKVVAHYMSNNGNIALREYFQKHVETKHNDVNKMSEFKGKLDTLADSYYYYVGLLYSLQSFRPFSNAFKRVIAEDGDMGFVIQLKGLSLIHLEALELTLNAIITTETTILAQQKALREGLKSNSKVSKAFERLRSTLLPQIKTDHANMLTFVLDFKTYLDKQTKDVVEQRALENARFVHQLYVGIPKHLQHHIELLKKMKVEVPEKLAGNIAKAAAENPHLPNVTVKPGSDNFGIDDRLDLGFTLPEESQSANNAESRVASRTKQGSSSSVVSAARSSSSSSSANPMPAPLPVATSSSDVVVSSPVATSSSTAVIPASAPVAASSSSASATSVQPSNVAQPAAANTSSRFEEIPETVAEKMVRLERQNVLLQATLRKRVEESDKIKDELRKKEVELEKKDRILTVYKETDAKKEITAATIEERKKLFEQIQLAERFALDAPNYSTRIDDLLKQVAALTTELGTVKTERDTLKTERDTLKKEQEPLKASSVQSEKNLKFANEATAVARQSNSIITDKLLQVISESTVTPSMVEKMKEFKLAVDNIVAITQRINAYVTLYRKTKGFKLFDSDIKGFDKYAKEWTSQASLEHHVGLFASNMQDLLTNPNTSVVTVRQQYASVLQSISNGLTSVILDGEFDNKAKKYKEGSRKLLMETYASEIHDVIPKDLSQPLTIYQPEDAANMHHMYVTGVVDEEQQANASPVQQWEFSDDPTTVDDTAAAVPVTDASTPSTVADTGEAVVDTGSRRRVNDPNTDDDDGPALK